MVFFPQLQIFIALLLATFTAASPVDISPREPAELQGRQTDWGNYAYVSSITNGLIGQNMAVISMPGNRAACPGEVYDLQSCASSWESECMDERWAFEWCLQNRITYGTCGAEWLNMTLGCMAYDSAYCVETLITLQNCATAITIPTEPPPRHRH